MKLFNRHYINQFFMGSALIVFVLLHTYCGSTVPQDSCGFVQNSMGQRISWKSHVPIRLYFHTGFPQQYRQAALNAIATWEGYIGRKIFIMSGDTGITQAHDNMSVLYWANNGWDNSTSESKSQQANTTIYWADNQVLEADLVVNGSGYIFSMSPSDYEVDVESLMLHELGHVMGLKHTNSEPSVMNESLRNGTLRRTLYTVDQINVKCEY